MRPLPAASLALALALLAGGCAVGGEAPPAPEPPDAAERVEQHLLDHGARRASSDHPDRYWFSGSIILPAGGTTCAVASITAGSHGPLVTDAVFDASGTVTVRIRAAPDQRNRCVRAAADALEGFDAGAADDD